MSRISALPVLQYCSGAAMVDAQVEQLEFTRTLRGTVFHHYCATGSWGEKFQLLSKEDQDEILDWKVPYAFTLTWRDSHSCGANAPCDSQALTYGEAIKEAEVQLRYGSLPDQWIPGHIDMYWLVWFPNGKLYAVVVDIKSNYRAVADGVESLQLHGYGHALLQKYPEIAGYLPGIYSASDGTWYVRQHADGELAPVERGDWDQIELEERIVVACSREYSGYHLGTHCIQCWKRARCPAFLVEYREAPGLARVLSLEANEGEARELLITMKRMEESYKAAKEALQAWVMAKGPVPDETGRKEWRPHPTKGRESMDKNKVRALLEKAGHDESEYTSIGPTYSTWSLKLREDAAPVKRKSRKKDQAA